MNIRVDPPPPDGPRTPCEQDIMFLAYACLPIMPSLLQPGQKPYREDHNGGESSTTGQSDPHLPYVDVFHLSGVNIKTAAMCNPT